MLVLSRQEGESILIGDDVEIIVKSFAGGKVSIGIKAPRDVKIRRGELVEKDKVTAAPPPAQT